MIMINIITFCLLNIIQTAALTIFFNIIFSIIEDKKDKQDTKKGVIISEKNELLCYHCKGYIAPAEALKNFETVLPKHCPYCGQKLRD